MTPAEILDLASLCAIVGRTENGHFKTFVFDELALLAFCAEYKSEIKEEIIEKLNEHINQV